MTTSSLDLLTAALQEGPATVKDLAAASGLSESRVRELLKEVHDLQTDGGRPAKFWVGESQVEEDEDVCPFCGAGNEDMVPAGPEGTFLGDSVLLCHQCDKAHNLYSKVEVALPKARKSRKAPLNPQYKINAKVAAVEAAGGTLTFDKATRLWALQLPEYGVPVLMTSQEFSFVDHKTILELPEPRVQSGRL